MFSFLAGQAMLLQNQSAFTNCHLCLLQMLEDHAASGNAEALDEFLQKYAGSKALLQSVRSSRDNIPAQYNPQDLDLTAGERSITSSVRWMNAF